MPVYQRFGLPDVGEGLTEAEVVEWRVAVGDAVDVNQVLVEIETAKSLVELPSPWAGVVTALLVEAATTVAVGTPLLEIDTDPTGEPPTPAALSSSAPTRRFGVNSSVRTDDLEPNRRVGGESGDGTGDEGAGGAVLVGYGTGGGDEPRRRRGAESASASPTGAASVPATEAALDTVTSQTPATPATPATAGPTPGPTTSGPGSTDLPSVVADPGAADTRSGTAAAHGIGHALAKPPVRKLARDLGIDLEVVTPTGPGGIVTREDVLAQHEATKPQPLATYPGDDAPWLATGTVSPDGRRTRVPVKSVRKRTAEAMVASAFTAPHVTVFHTVDVTATMNLVETLRASREFADVKVTPLLIAAKALLLAVRRHPEINASWDEDAQEIVYKHYVNLGIAAATPRGLVVPNVKDAHRLALLPLAREIADLASTARAGRTTPEALADGTITITNVGVFGIDTGTPILNPGEAAILAFGAIRQQPWVHKGKVKPRHVTQLALSFDHRLVDGELGSRVLADVASVLSDPGWGLVWG